MPQQTLHTERLTLVPLSDEHLELEAEMDADAEWATDARSTASACGPAS